MSNISAAMVKELREQTGAGMMDCKSALTEVQGDMEAAVDWLRKKGLSKAAKKAGRVAAEGLVAVKVKGLKGVAVEVNSETDFVARNPEFQAMVAGIADIVFEVGADVEAIKAAAWPEGGTVQEKIASTVAKIGENMTLRRAAILSVGQGALATYVHNPVVPGMGRIGVVVALESAGNGEKLAELGRQIAMHVASANPLAVEPSGVDPVWSSAKRRSWPTNTASRASRKRRSPRSSIRASGPISRRSPCSIRCRCIRAMTARPSRRR